MYIAKLGLVPQLDHTGTMSLVESVGESLDVQELQIQVQDA